MNTESAMSLGSLNDYRDLVMFRLGRQTYALPIEPIVRITEMVTITPIPQVNHIVEGVINVRGATVPVVNMRRQMGLPEAGLELDTHIILVQIGRQVAGLIVDEVLDVLSLPDGQIARPKDFLVEGLGEAPLLQGLAQTPNGMISVLDIQHLFSPSQARALAQAVAKLPGDISDL